MNIEELRNYCLSKSGTTEEFPFDESTLVFKVVGKIYALTDLESDLSINLKCLPEKAIELREQHRCVLPGYHMNKKHWNTVLVDGSVSDRQIQEWIDHSYTLVVEKLSRKQKDELSQL
ncbi:MmcQ/YjbR family DNA-binding protein [Sunxiuqinia sp. sy24]|uniref:MmcQ/YjbR family DNA-binding protein n=1 Tax=Sunxiuqinia sp. sy24 TaxID=3461495 RepID=UPI0040455D40